MSTKRRRREKLHPLERGFSGHQIVGQKLGPPPPVGDVALDDFQTYCLEVCLHKLLFSEFQKIFCAKKTRKF